MPTDFGTDISSVPDLDDRFALVSGAAALGQALARRLETPRGGLWYAPNYGTDIRGRLNDTLTQAELAALPGEIEAECEKDERVRRASAQVQFVPQTSTLTVAISVETALGPFRLVLAATALTVELLQVQPG